MKLKLTWLLTLFMAFVMQLSFGQEKDITGTVTDTGGLPLPGVNVIVKGTSKGTQTDFDGKYTLKNVKVGEVIVFSFVSMKTSENVIGTGNVYNLTMKDDVASLDEVVITGYATTTKAKSSVSSVRVTSETIENRPNASFVQTLAGQVPGLNITTTTGQPGGNSLVQLRGVSSINGNTEPLFIIDGAPVDEDNFRSLNPQEIASIDVLKDAGATAIYGNRGANGVIIIKTRQGSFNQGLRVGYNGFVSYSSLPGNDYNLATSQQLLEYERLRGVGAGAGATANKGFRPTTDFATGLPIPENQVPLTDAQIAAAPNFDWVNFFLRTSQSQNHTVTLSSGGENSTQFTSIGFSDTQGILVNSSLQRFNIRTNVSGKSSNDKFTYGSNLSVNYSTSEEPNNIGTGAVNRNFVLGSLLSFPYNTPDQFDIAQPGVIAAPSVVDTPFFLLDLLDTFARIEEEVKIVGSFNFSYKINDNLSANAVLSADYQNEIRTTAQFPNAINSQIFGGNNEFQTQTTNREFTYNQVTSLNYNKVFGKHTIDVGAYTEYFKAHQRFFGATARGLVEATFAVGDGDSFIGDNPNDDIFVDDAFADRLDSGLFSYFGSFDYDYDTKYGFSATLRRDASSRFAESNRFATFWSLSGRWNISNEAFMDGSVINNLKLRGSIGTAGNQDIVGAGPFSALNETLDLFATVPGLASAPSLQLAQIGNRNLRWETVRSLNIGVDFGVWNNRLRGTIDYYQRNTSDLFQNVNLSPATGFVAQNANVGELQNTGVDFQFDYDLIRANAPGDLALSVGVVGNFNATEIIDLPEEELIGTGREGGILGEYFLIRYAGVNPANGNLLYLDANDNLTENPSTTDDRVWLDKNILPDWTGGFTFNLDYKGFFLTTQWNYTIGVDRFDGDYAGFVDVDNAGSFQLSADILREWTQPGDITDIPSPTATNRNTFTAVDDNFLYSGDFLRLRFASIGYNFNQTILEGTGLTRARVFFNAENALTFDKWRGFDVEGRDNGGAEFPTPRTFSVGLELGF